MSGVAQTIGLSGLAGTFVRSGEENETWEHMVIRNLTIYEAPAPALADAGILDEQIIKHGSLVLVVDTRQGGTVPETLYKLEENARAVPETVIELQPNARTRHKLFIFGDIAAVLRKWREEGPSLGFNDQVVVDEARVALRFAKRGITQRSEAALYRHRRAKHAGAHAT